MPVSNPPLPILASVPLASGVAGLNWSQARNVSTLAIVPFQSVFVGWKYRRVLASATRCSALVLDTAAMLSDANSAHVAPPSVETHQLPWLVFAVVIARPATEWSLSVTFDGPLPSPTRLDTRKP